MPTSFPASRPCWLFCCATLIAISIVGTAFAQEPQPKVTVRMWVVEVEIDKLRNLGFDWSQITSGGKSVTTPVSTAGDVASAFASTNATEFKGFLEALEQNSLARTLAEPTLATLSGRTASLEVGRQTKLEVTPTAIDGQQIELQYRIELANSGESPESAHFVNASTVQVEAGKPCLISTTRGTSPSANGKSRQTETLLLVQADFLSPVR
jgi:hypothetical protein